MSKVRVIICPVDRAPYVTNISATLNNLQALVGGYIEAVTVGGYKSVILCDESGIINDKRVNPSSFVYPQIFGDFIIIGADEGGFKDVPISEKDRLLKIVKANWEAKKKK